jgi:hypothetical protein
MEPGSRILSPEKPASHLPATPASSESTRKFHIPDRLITGDVPDAFNESENTMRQRRVARCFRNTGIIAAIPLS